MENYFEAPEEQEYFKYHSIITMLIEDVEKSENLNSFQKFRLKKFLGQAQWHCIGMVSKMKENTDKKEN